MAGSLGLDALLAHAQTAASAAATAIGRVRRVTFATKTTASDLVTEYDVRSEEAIRRALGDATPEIPVVGEERGGEAAARYWCVDPIDGTVNFAHGLPLWAISIGLVEHGVPQVGVVLAPGLGQMFFAARGQGAFMTSQLDYFAEEAVRPLRVSDVTRVSASLLVSGFPYDLSNPFTSNFAQWEALYRQSHACRRLGAAALDMCYVAQGWFDGFWETGLRPWDVAAAAVILEEAGGRITTSTGGGDWLASGDLVATNGRIHDELCELLQVARPVVANAT